VPAAAGVLPPGPTFLTVVADRSRATIPASRVCSTADPVVLQCDLFPLLPAQRRLCPPPGTASATTAGVEPGDGSPAAAGAGRTRSSSGGTPASAPCELPGPETRLAGWVLSQAGGPSPTSTLRIYLGVDHLQEVVDAREGAATWASVAVCPRDITGDGLTDLVVAFRTRQNPDRLDVEAVDLSTQELRVMVLPPQRSPLSRGQGCAAPAVNEVRYDAADRQLVLGPDRRS
jgi:hypothetical protein